MSQQTAKQSNTEQRNIEQSAEYQKPALDKAGNLAEQLVERHCCVAQTEHGQCTTESEQSGAVLAGIESSSGHGEAHILAMVIT